ncbi:hypothetical protein JB92DRAFT_2865035 [Gautieria morchelliformis]|nr:hypothetical protein JB92DRAFT_2865035 [Gautieria morchelliformis]
MYPHQDHHPMSPPNDDDDTLYNAYPVVSSLHSDIAPPPALDPHYYPSQYQDSYPNAYPQPCLQDYSQYPPQLHIQTDDLHPQHHDSPSPYAYASTSASTLTPYPPPTPPSPAPHTAPFGHTEYVYGSHPAHQPPHRSHPEALATSLWHPSPPADSPLLAYPRSVSEPVATSQHCSPAYDDAHPSPPYTPPALSYYQDPSAQSQPEGEQFAVSDVYRPDLQHPHPSQYTAGPLSQPVYEHDQHQDMFPLQMIHQDTMGLYHPSASFAHASLSPVENSEGRPHASAFDPSPLPPSEGIFDSPLREPLRDSFEENTEHAYPSLPGPDMEQGLIHHMQVEGAFQEHPPPSAVYSEAGPSWASSSPDDYDQSPYAHAGTDYHEQHLSEQSALGLHPAPQLSLAGPQPAHAMLPFQGPLRQSPMEEENLSRVHAPGGTPRAPIRPSQLLEPEPIPRLTNPRRSRPPPASGSGSGEGPSISPSYLTSTRSDRRTSPSSRPHSAHMEEPLPQAPIVPSQSHLAPRRDRTDRRRHHSQPSFRPFHPYPSHQRAGASEGSSSFMGGSGGGGGGICIPPAPVFGLFGSYPLSRGPREQPLPGPTCAPESSSSVMRLVLTPPFKRPPPPPPPPPVQPARRPRMACFFCRKRKIACGPGPQPPPSAQPGNMDDNDKDSCNQCARRGLKCKRPTESRRGVRRGNKARGKEAEHGEDAVEEAEEGPGLGESRVRLALSLRPPVDQDETAPSDEDGVTGLDADDREEEEDHAGAEASSTRKMEEQ